MFGRQNLLQDGLESQAVILDARPGNILNRHGERNWHLRIRVHYDDGQTAEIDCELYDLGIATVGPASGLEPYPLSAGVVIPVRIGQNDPTKVAIDRPKIIADTISAYAADRQQKIAKAESRLASPPKPPHRNPKG